MATDIQPGDKIPVRKAIAMLAAGRTVRRSTQIGPVLLSGDMKKWQAVRWLKQHGALKSGPNASADGFGLYVLIPTASGNDLQYFLETKET